jgi:hypothetical protein
MVGNFPGMDNVINFRKRAQRFEERAATATDPEARGHWQRVADAWHRAAEAAARTPPLIWGWERDGGGTISGAIVPGHFPPKDTSLVTIFIGLAGRSLLLRACRNCRAAPELTKRHWMACPQVPQPSPIRSARDPGCPAGVLVFGSARGGECCAAPAYSSHFLYLYLPRCARRTQSSSRIKGEHDPVELSRAWGTRARSAAALASGLAPRRPRLERPHSCGACALHHRTC